MGGEPSGPGVLDGVEPREGQRAGSRAEWRNEHPPGRGDGSRENKTAYDDGHDANQLEA
jgi:hypothetical protein